MAEEIKVKEVIKPTEEKPKEEAKKIIKPKEEPKEEETEDQVFIKAVLKGLPKTEVLEKMTPLQRFASLKVHVRQILLRKSEKGYDSRYFYIPLKRLQLVFTNIEAAYGFTSMYSQEREIVEGKIFVDATRELFDTKSGSLVAKTKIDITDLVLNKIEPNEEHTLNYLERVLQIAQPRDAWEMIFLNYFDPQKKGSYSTYFQRYTYFQLYDFQEADYDDIEEKPQGKDDGKKNPNADFKSQKQKRAEDTEVAKLRKEIRTSYDKDLIISLLPTGKKFSELNLEELKKLEEEILKGDEK